MTKEEIEAQAILDYDRSLGTVVWVMDLDYIDGDGNTETFWCDYILFDPRQPEEWQLDVRRVKRDPQIVTKITVGVRQFLRELEERMLAA